MLRPGARDFVTARFQTQGRTGALAKTIRVTTNDPAHPQVVLACNGQVNSVFSGPAQRIQFGRIERSAGPQSKTITLSRRGQEPITPKLLPVERDGVKAALREVEAGKQYELDVTIGPPWPNGDLRAVVRVDPGIPGVPQEQFQVFAGITPRVEAKPNRFTIPPEMPAASDYRVKVVWGGEPLGKLLSAEVTDPRLSVRIEEAPDHQKLILEVPAGYQQSRPPPMVKVRTDDKDVPEFTVSVRSDSGRRGRAKGRTAPRPLPKAAPAKVPPEKKQPGN